MRIQRLLAALFMAGAMPALASNVVIRSFHGAGQLVFDEISDARSYRIQWAPLPGGPWMEFGDAAAQLGVIPATGQGAVTVAVPMAYRVISDTTPLIPAGAFVMGFATNTLPYEEDHDAEFPQHRVIVSAFKIERTEVTKALWDQVKIFADANGYGFANPGAGKAPAHPVHSVSWYDAVKWCNARSEQEGMTPVYYSDENLTAVYRTNDIDPYLNWTANGYRLPTEAEWEKAARGGAAFMRFPWSDANTISHSRANYSATNSRPYDLSGDVGYHPTYATGGEPYTSPVGSFQPNGYGLYDMAGNVLEWCWDHQDMNYYTFSPLIDPRGPEDSQMMHSARGGTWGADADMARVSARLGLPPNFAHGYIGFRCARNAY
jgi:sulfatase modifying factor 1